MFRDICTSSTSIYLGMYRDILNFHIARHVQRYSKHPYIKAYLEMNKKFVYQGMYKDILNIPILGHVQWYTKTSMDQGLFLVQRCTKHPYIKACLEIYLTSIYQGRFRDVLNIHISKHIQRYTITSIYKSMLRDILKIHIARHVQRYI